MADHPPDEVLTIKEVAAAMRVHHHTVRRHIAAGRLRATKRGNLWFIRRQWLEAFLDGDQDPGVNDTRASA